MDPTASPQNDADSITVSSKPAPSHLVTMDSTASPQSDGDSITVSSKPAVRIFRKSKYSGTPEEIAQAKKLQRALKKMFNLTPEQRAAQEHEESRQLTMMALRRRLKEQQRQRRPMQDGFRYFRMFERYRIYSPPLEGRPVVGKQKKWRPDGVLVRVHKAWEKMVDEVAAQYRQQVTDWTLLMLHVVPLRGYLFSVFRQRYYTSKISTDEVFAMQTIHSVIHRVLDIIRDEVEDEMEEFQQDATKVQLLREEEQGAMLNEYQLATPPSDESFRTNHHSMQMPFDYVSDILAKKPRTPIATILKRYCGLQDFCRLLQHPWMSPNRRALFAPIIHMHTEYTISELAAYEEPDVWSGEAPTDPDTELNENLEQWKPDFKPRALETDDEEMDVDMDFGKEIRNDVSMTLAELLEADRLKHNLEQHHDTLDDAAPDCPCYPYRSFES